MIRVNGHSQLAITSAGLTHHAPRHDLSRCGATDGVGFEPTVRYERTQAFQACALNHSATRPNLLNNPTARLTSFAAPFKAKSRSLVAEFTLREGEALLGMTVRGRRSSASHPRTG